MLADAVEELEHRRGAAAVDVLGTALGVAGRAVERTIVMVADREAFAAVELAE